MSFLQYAFRTAVFQQPAASPDAADSVPSRLFFWTFHGEGSRADKGFIYQTEITGEQTASKRASDRVDWQTARSLMATFEAEAEKTAPRADEKDTAIQSRLARSDAYTQSGSFDTHPQLLQEQDIARLQEMAAAAPKLARRPKPAGSK